MAIKRNVGTSSMGQLSSTGLIVASIVACVTLLVNSALYLCWSIVRKFCVDGEQGIEAIKSFYRGAPVADQAMAAARAVAPPVATSPEVASRTLSVGLVARKDVYLHLRYYLNLRTIRHHIVVRDKGLIKKLTSGGGRQRHDIPLTDFILSEGMHFEEAAAICTKEALSHLETLKGPRKPRKPAAKIPKIEYLPAPKQTAEGSDFSTAARGPRSGSVDIFARTTPGKVVRGVLRYCGSMDGMNHSTKETYQTFGIQLESEGEEDGAITYMGVDLERALEVSGASVGDLIELRFEGFVEVPGGKASRFNRKKKWSIEIITTGTEK